MDKAIQAAVDFHRRVVASNAESPDRIPRDSLMIVLLAEALRKTGKGEKEKTAVVE